MKNAGVEEHVRQRGQESVVSLMMERRLVSLENSGGMRMGCEEEGCRAEQEPDIAAPWRYEF